MICNRRERLYIEIVFRNRRGAGVDMIDLMPKSQRRQRSTLAQVARAAGVSVATASRALNDDNTPLRAGRAARANKIRQMAQKLGYRPDWRARSLRGGQSNS